MQSCKSQIYLTAGPQDQQDRKTSRPQDIQTTRPQDPSFNRGIWSSLEAQVRNWTSDYDSLFIITGPVLTSNKGILAQIASVKKNGISRNIVEEED